MAERAANYLAEYPERGLIVLAGSGHLAYGSGIPQRLQRRIPVATAIVLQQDHSDTAHDPAQADFTVQTEEIILPPGGRIGVMLDRKPGDTVQVTVERDGSDATRRELAFDVLLQ